jgi:hypothetical protein
VFINIYRGLQLARFCGSNKLEYFLANANGFKEACLIQGNSILIGESV